MEISQAAPLELQEYLFANTAMNFVGDKMKLAPHYSVRDHVRSTLRLHRFLVISWLMSNGVRIPVDLLSDQMHPQVGQQMPDQPVPAARSTD